jgi:hypothetical protein
MSCNLLIDSLNSKMNRVTKEADKEFGENFFVARRHSYMIMCNI